MNPDTPPNFFAVALLAVANTPALFLPNGESANPRQPLLFSLTIHAEHLPDDVEAAQAMLCQAAAAQVAPTLPPGFVVSLACANPVPAQAILKAAAQLTGNGEGLFAQPETIGTPFLRSVMQEGTFNTYRPGSNARNRSPRFAFLCPYCGTPNLRFTGNVDARTPDGFRVVLNMDADEKKHVGERMANVLLDAQDRARWARRLSSPVIANGPDHDPASPWEGHCGAAFDLTCDRGHVSTLRFVEDLTAPGAWSMFLVFHYAEGSGAWLSPELPGSGVYPAR